MKSTILVFIFFCAIGLSQSQDSGPTQSAIPHEQRPIDKSCHGDGNCTFVGRQKTPNRDEPMKDDNDDDEGYGLIDGKDVPEDNEMVNSTFKATYNVSDSEVPVKRECTVNFVEKTHLLVTAAHCCERFPSGPHLTLGNGYTDDFIVNVYGSFMHSTYLLRDRMSDVCVVVLNYAVPGVTPLKFSYTKGKAKDIVAVYGYGWYETKFPHDGKKNVTTSKHLKTGTVRIASDLNPSAVQVGYLTVQVCPGDSGGACINSNKEFFAVVQGGDPGTCARRFAGTITEFESLQNWIKDIVSRFDVPPNQPGTMR